MTKYVFIDQFGTSYRANTVKEFIARVPGGRVTKMYVDKLDGKSVHIGYVVGQYWYTQYQIVERDA
jgi:hypothetical protein